MAERERLLRRGRRRVVGPVVARSHQMADLVREAVGPVGAAPRYDGEGGAFESIRDRLHHVRVSAARGVDLLLRVVDDEDHDIRAECVLACRARRRARRPALEGCSGRWRDAPTPRTAFPRCPRVGSRVGTRLCVLARLVLSPCTRGSIRASRRRRPPLLLAFGVNSTRTSISSPRIARAGRRVVRARSQAPEGSRISLRPKLRRVDPAQHVVGSHEANLEVTRAGPSLVGCVAMLAARIVAARREEDGARWLAGRHARTRSPTRRGVRVGSDRTSSSVAVPVEKREAAASSPQASRAAGDDVDGGHFPKDARVRLLRRHLARPSAGTRARGLWTRASSDAPDARRRSDPDQGGLGCSSAASCRGPD